MDAIEAAHVVKAIMVERFSSTCHDPQTARAWYQRNIHIWDPAKIATHGPESVTKAHAGIALEGVPDGESGPDCWGVEISEDAAALRWIDGWYLECRACYLVFIYPDPTTEDVADLQARRRRSDNERSPRL